MYTDAMRISKLRIHNYKSLEKPFFLDTPGKLHFFIGPNNSGKTNILDAIYQFFNTDNVRLEDLQGKIELEITFGEKKKQKLLAVQSEGKNSYYLNAKRITKQEAWGMLGSHIVRLCATKEVNYKRLSRTYNELVGKYPGIYKIFHDTLKAHIPQIQLSTSLFNKRCCYNF